MNVIGKFSYPEDMKIIEDYLKQKGYAINCKPEELEKLWYAFSERYDAGWLSPNVEFLDFFIEYAKNIDIEDAERMDYYGNIIGKED